MFESPLDIFSLFSCIESNHLVRQMSGFFKGRTYWKQLRKARRERLCADFAGTSTDSRGVPTAHCARGQFFLIHLLVLGVYLVSFCDAKCLIKPLRAWAHSRHESQEKREPRLNVKKLRDEKVVESFNRRVRVELGKGAQTEAVGQVNEPSLVIYMDGSSTGRRPETRKGGWAFVVVEKRESE